MSLLRGSAALALACVAAQCSGSSRRAPALTSVAAGGVLVDFSTPATGAWAPNGILHSSQSYSTSAGGLADLRDGLQIGAWRVGSEGVAEMTHKAGIRTTLLLYDVWKHDRRDAWPFQDLSGYEEWLRPIVQRHRDRPIVWEVWNEWDLGLPWWGGSEADLFATYARADRVIRSVAGPEALVAGPSYNRFDKERFRAFAEYCLAAGCQVNVFTWHEIKEEGSAQIAAHVRWVRDSIAAAPRYAPLRIRELDVNEIVARAERYSTGDLVVALRGLHEGGAAYFARSCWREATNREYECLNGSYDGIIDTATRRPRGAWWVHAAYARIRRDPVLVQGDPHSTAIAGLLGSGARAGVILATGTGAGAADSILRIAIRGLAAIAPQGTPLTITAYLIPWKQGDGALPRLTAILDRSVTSTAEALRFELPAAAREVVTTEGGERLAGRSAYLITVTRSPAPALNSLLMPRPAPD